MLVIANWKMNKTVAEAVATARRARRLLPRRGPVAVVIAPPFTALDAMHRALTGGPIRLAGQNMHWEAAGAFTGEVSPRQLRDVGCRYVLVGHSERRRIFGEPDEAIGRKVRAALDHGLRPVLCIGESLDERRANRTVQVLERQLETGLAHVPADEATRCVVAYEPVWAIGTGIAAENPQIAEAHALVCKWLDNALGAAARRIPVLYGGSVTPENVERLVAIEAVDGVLVGGASLTAEGLVAIVTVCSGVARARRRARARTR
jgi:triosephosphate isomerase